MQITNTVRQLVSNFINESIPQMGEDLGDIVCVNVDWDNELIFFMSQLHMKAVPIAYVTDIHYQFYNHGQEEVML